VTTLNQDVTKIAQSFIIGGKAVGYGGFGGGGYSGGGGGLYSCSFGGGGGSYNVGTNPSNSDGSDASAIEGNGKVVIEY